MSSEQKTIEDLREMLFTTIDNLNNGDIKAAEAKVIANLATQINKTAEIELNYAELQLKLEAEGKELAAPMMLTGRTKKIEAIEPEDNSDIESEVIESGLIWEDLNKSTIKTINTDDDYRITNVMGRQFPGVKTPTGTIESIGDAKGYKSIEDAKNMVVEYSKSKSKG